MGVIGLGSHVPSRVITNRQISAWTGVTEDWVWERTGIRERRYAEPGTATSDLAWHAARQALDAHPDARGRLALLIVATCTPDVPQPATAAILQHKLGVRSIPAFDVNSVCTGFLFAVDVAISMLRTSYRGGYGLVVGADMFSVLMDRGDRRTVSLFGDGAGAVLLGEVPAGYGFQATAIVTDGDGHRVVGVDAGGTRTPLDARAIAAGEHHFHMDGRAAKDYVFTTMPKLIDGVLADSRIDPSDVDRYIVHQANGRMLAALARQMGVPAERVEITATHYGNTAAASIPLTLHASHRRRPIQRGERLVLAGAGGGLSAGAATLVWH
ncbi:3-oxoacyl-ACP synthase III family protein [Actinokineospora sp. 24-640]